MSTYATMTFMAYVAAGSGALGWRKNVETSEPKSEVRRRARAVMATTIKAVVKEDTLWECAVYDITDTHLELQLQVSGNEVPRVSAEKVRQTHRRFARIFPAAVCADAWPHDAKSCAIGARVRADVLG